MQAARADILGLLVDLHRVGGELRDAVGREFERDAFDREQLPVLFGQRVLGRGQDRLEILGGQRVQLHANRKAALEFGDQIRGFALVECARGDEQDVVGLDRAVFGRHGAAFDDGQDVALHAFARNVGSAAALATARDLVDLVDEDDAVFARAVHRFALDRVHVDQFVRLLLREDAARFGYGHAFARLAFGQESAEHLAHVGAAAHLVHAAADRADR